MTLRAALLTSLLAALAGVALGAAPKPLPKFERVMALDTPRAVGDLAMTDHNGAPQRLSDLAGTPTLVFFGFTNCPDVCPTTLQQLARIKSAEPKKLAGLRIAFISVDGERDTPGVMKEYLKRFSVDFVGLTAPAEQVRTLALSFSAPFFKDPPKNGEYAVQHSSRVFALDKQGRLRAEFYEAAPDAVVGIAQVLLAE